jgi:hypothetical protein
MHEAQNARLKKRAMRYRDLSTHAQRQAASPDFSQCDLIFATGAAGEILAEDLGRQFFRVLSRCRLLRVSVVWGTHGVRTRARGIVAKRRSRLKIA